MIIDCHTHWGMCWNDRDGANPGNWLAIMDRHGVDQAFLMPHAGITRLDLCRADNDRVAEVVAHRADRLIPIGTAWPQTGQASLREVRRCVEKLGMRGLKFHPWLQGFSLTDPCFHKICALMGDAGLPVFFHDGTPCYSLPEQVGGLARQFPRTKFVLGHAGILWCWRSAMEAARQPNVWVCLCGPHMRAMEIICRAVVSERLLWGTDFGFGFADSIEYRLNLIQCANIDSGLRKKILGENPLKLLEKAQFKH